MIIHNCFHHSGFYINPKEVEVPVIKLVDLSIELKNEWMNTNEKIQSKWRKGNVATDNEKEEDKPY